METEHLRDLRDLPYVRQVAEFLCQVTPNLTLSQALWLVDQMPYAELEENYGYMVELNNEGR